jgi:hypothetical protein
MTSAEAQDIANFHHNEVVRLNDRIDLLFDLIQRNKAWPGADEELAEAQSALRALMIAEDMEKHNE